VERRERERTVTDPQRQGDVEEQQQRPQAEVDSRTRKPRVEDDERDASGGETTAGRDVTGATVRQVAEDGVRRDLGAEDLEDGREGQEVLAETDDRANDTALRKLLEEEREES
jgi:hypothetical protein